MQLWGLIAQKGGSGKTTLSIHLAVAATQAGLKVEVLDVDPQQSAAKWGYARKTAPEITATVAPKLGDLALDAEKRRVDILIVDTSPRADRDCLLVARQCTLIVVPVRPTILDIPAVDDTINLLRQADLQHKAVLVLNAVAPSTKEGEMAAAVLVEKGVTLCPVRIGERVDLRQSLIEMQGVTEFTPKGPAAKEIIALYKWLTKAAETIK